MLNVKNLATGEVVRVYRVSYDKKEGTFRFDGIPSARVIEKKLYMFTTDGSADAEGNIRLNLKEGWEYVRGRGVANGNKPQATAGETKPQEEAIVATPQATEIEEPVVVEEVVMDEPQAKPHEEPVMESHTGDKIVDAFAALTPLFRGVQKNVENAVMAQFKPLIAKLQEQAQTQVQHIIVTSETGGQVELDEVVCSDFEEILTYVNCGVPVYLYGAAGCGKSHTARQLAKALGLPFYESMQVMFAHDVKGYGDAGGNYQATPFFKAFTEGGLFFLDEVDASAPEALVVLNTAIANRRFDFPIIGNVEAHPNFRVVAAGNTAMTGADVEYVARSVQDAATENRFSFFEMKYDKKVELPVHAHGDTVLYNFITDLRQAIKEANVVRCVSYRQTALLANPLLVKFGMAKALTRNVFKGMEQDEIRIIYQNIKDKKNIWAVAMAELFES